MRLPHRGHRRRHRGRAGLSRWLEHSLGGRAAVFLFRYLELLDVTSSFDTVVGALSVALDIALITIGLAIGAVCQQPYADRRDQDANGLEYPRPKRPRPGQRDGVDDRVVEGDRRARSHNAARPVQAVRRRQPGSAMTWHFGHAWRGGRLIQRREFACGRGAAACGYVHSVAVQ
jgi:hypothetical protein